MALELQSTTAATYLDPLYRKGALARTRRAHRGWRITDLGRQLLMAVDSPAREPDDPLGAPPSS